MMKSSTLEYQVPEHHKLYFNLIYFKILAKYDPKKWKKHAILSNIPCFLCEKSLKIQRIYKMLFFLFFINPGIQLKWINKNVVVYSVITDLYIWSSIFSPLYIPILKWKSLKSNPYSNVHKKMFPPQNFFILSEILTIKWFCL